MSISTHRHSQSGFSLIEVLVSSFILAVGLLGVSSMQFASLKNNLGAYHQSQANVIMKDVLDRVRANREGFVAGEYDAADTGGTVPTAQACITATAGCTTAELALQDIREFASYFNDVDSAGSNFVPSIPGGRLIIQRDATNSLATVTIYWNQDTWSEVSGSIQKNVATQQLQMVVKI